jgi:4-amino-4-deoxy-L-arabinose transferase-like glycosyltransferase
MGTSSARLRSFAFDAVRRLAALAALASAYQFVAGRFELTWLAVTVVSALVVATGSNHWELPSPPPPALPWPQPRALWLGLTPGWALMTIAAIAKARHLSTHLVLWVWLGGAAWLLVSAWRASRPAPPSPAPTTRSVWAWALVVTAVAAVLRVWEIDAIPRQVHCDEGKVNLVAWEFYDNPERDWFAPPRAGGAYSIPNLHFALVGSGTLLLGFNLVGARASDVVLGILSVLLLFDALRRVANLRLAVVSALLLAANHCHLAYSRIATGQIQTAFVVTLLLDLLARLWTAPTCFNAVLLGVVAALGVQTYSASMASLPLLIAVLVVLFILHPQRRRALLVPCTLFVITCATAVAPFGVAVWEQGNELAGRSHQVNIFSPPMMAQLKREVYRTDSAAAVVAHQTWNAVRGFHVGHDAQPQYGIDQPMADRYTAALMIPGAVLLLAGFRRLLTVCTLGFTLGYLLLGLGLNYAPGFGRVTGALPLAMTTAAIALVQCCGTLWSGRHRLARWALDASLAGAVLLCTVANLKIYLVDFVQARVSGDADSEAGWLAREYGNQYQIHLVEWFLPGLEGLRLIASDVPVIFNESRDPVGYVQHVQVDKPSLFLIRNDNSPALAALLARFPNARVQTYRRHPVHGPTLRLVFVDASTAQAAPQDAGQPP